MGARAYWCRAVVSLNIQCIDWKAFDTTICHLHFHYNEFDSTDAMQKINQFIHEKKEIIYSTTPNGASTKPLSVSPRNSKKKRIIYYLAAFDRQMAATWAINASKCEHVLCQLQKSSYRTWPAPIAHTDRRCLRIAIVSLKPNIINNIDAHRTPRNPHIIFSHSVERNDCEKSHACRIQLRRPTNKWHHSHGPRRAPSTDCRLNVIQPMADADANSRWKINFMTILWRWPAAGRFRRPSIWRHDTYQFLVTKLHTLRWRRWYDVVSDDGQR